MLGANKHEYSRMDKRYGNSLTDFSRDLLERRRDHYGSDTHANLNGSRLRAEKGINLCANPSEFERAQYVRALHSFKPAMA